MKTRAGGANSLPGGCESGEPVPSAQVGCSVAAYTSLTGAALCGAAAGGLSDQIRAAGGRVWRRWPANG